MSDPNDEQEPFVWPLTTYELKKAALAKADVVTRARAAVAEINESYRDMLDEYVNQEHYDRDSLEYFLDRGRQLEFVRDAPELIRGLLGEIDRLRAIIEEGKGEL